jgi:hypothetical protein
MAQAMVREAAKGESHFANNIRGFMVSLKRADVVGEPGKGLHSNATQNP